MQWHSVQFNRAYKGGENTIFPLFVELFGVLSEFLWLEDV